MALLPIYETPDPMLRQISTPVEKLDDDMRAAGRRHVRDDVRRARHRSRRGPGRCAQRLLVMDLQEPEDPDDPDSKAVKEPRVFINPEIRRTRTMRCPTPRAACRCPTNMPR